MWEENSVKAPEIAALAAQLTAGERDRVHGNKLKNFGDIAGLWSGYLTRLLGVPVALKPSEAAAMMVCMKVARTLAGEHNLDDAVDAAGYAAIMGELAEGERG